MTRRPYSPEQRSAHLAEAVERLTEAVQAIATGDEWQRYLTFAGKLHHYSARNVALLYLQAYQRGWVDGTGSPKIGHVAGYRRWQELGRQVRRGERGLVVLAPCTYKKTDQETGEETWRLRGFRPEHVFEARQTDGDGEIPAPVTPTLLKGDGPAGAWQAIVKLVEGRGFTVEIGHLEPANGRTDLTTRHVLVSDRLEGAASVKTLAHELAHILLHDDGCDYAANRGRCECEAESVAFLVCDGLGLATDAYTFAYVAGWSGGEVKTVEQAADKAMTTARAILADLEKVETEARELIPA